MRYYKKNWGGENAIKYLADITVPEMNWFCRSTTVLCVLARERIFSQLTTNLSYVLIDGMS